MRHPGLKLNIPPEVFYVSWCAGFEFRGTCATITRNVHAISRNNAHCQRGREHAPSPGRWSNCMLAHRCGCQC